MKKVLTTFFVALVSAVIGAGLMFLFIFEFDKQNTIVVSGSDNEMITGIDNIYNAVVVVQNFQNNKVAGIGSGFIYRSEGYIMTNHHVIYGANEVKVILMSGETLDATVVGSDEYADIAVLKIDPKYIKKIATIGSSEASRVGDTVFTIGSPMSSDYSGTVTRGILSGKNRMVEVAVKSTANDWVMNVMQTDAAINPGNSGGPLCNLKGEVIGINSMKIVQDEIEGIGFAIPIEEAMEYANTIIKGEKVIRPYLGISMANLSTPTYTLRKEGITINSNIKSGVVVYRVAVGGPSEKAGIKKGDVIIKIGQYDVSSSARLKYYLSKYKPGDTVSVVLIRGNEQKTFNVVLEESD